MNNNVFQKVEIGYLYIRNHESYNKYGACKLGRCENIPTREGLYKTSEILRGFFTLVIELNKEILVELETKLKNYFEILGLQCYINAGTEFFKKDISLLIEPYLLKKNVPYRILGEDEINDLCRKVYENDKKLKEPFFSPYPIQKEVLDKIENFYNNNNIGRVIWACGLGKALLGIFIVQKLNFKKVVIGVPSTYLQEQMIKEVRKIFPHIPILCIGSKRTLDKIKFTTNYEYISKFIQENKVYFVITTYTSCYLLTKYKFDFKIGDEAHHLVGTLKESVKSYLKFHDIVSSKTLFMTATEKTLEDNNGYSMKDEVFGEIIDSKSVYWAIENKRITDYNLMILKNNQNDIEYIIDKLQIKVTNNELFVSAFMSLKSLEQYKDLSHILIYTNTTENSDLVKLYVDRVIESGILDNINGNNIYNKSLHCKKICCLEEEVQEFKNSQYGIISCVYIFGEGFDLPKLNGVTFGENMNSYIRIIQSSLRPNRLEDVNPEKMAYIILPYTEDNEKSFNNVKEIIKKIGNQDEKIECKMKAFTSTFFKKSENEEKTPFCDLLQNEDELLKIKLRLRYRKVLGSSLSEEQDEFNYVKQINKELHLTSKVDYVKKELEHSHYILEPERYFIGIWKNWYDFLGIDTSMFLKTKEEWKNFCKENRVNNTESYYKLYSQYPKLLPYEPSEFYPNCGSVYIELGIPKRRRRG